MATAREIHRHLKGIKNIGQITKAMKMVAAARLRKAQEKAGSSRPYAVKIKEVLANIVCDKGMVAGLDAKKHPLLQKREVKKIGYLVVCSDKGLAGAYSSNALKKAVAEISEIEGDVVIITSGRRERDFFTRRSYNDAVAIATDAAERFGDMQFDELHIVFTLFKTALSQIPTSDIILPVEPPEKETGVTKKSVEYLFLPEAEEILKVLAPRYLETIVYAALVQSAASELGARMTAMSSATDNAGKLVKNLELSYNKARQALITRELSEICGGAEALKQQ